MWVKRDGKWLIDGVANRPFMSTTARTPLTNWAGSLAIGSKARWYRPKSRGSWGAGRKLHRRAVEDAAGRADPLFGNAGHRLGRQPAKRSCFFMFDSRCLHRGSVDERGGWLGCQSGRGPSQRNRTASTKIYSRIDENTAIWESIDDEVAGEPGVDMRLRITRKQPKKERECKSPGIRKQ